MFYNASAIVNFLKCQHCSQAYDEKNKPRILPCCGKTTCSSCINVLESKVENNTFECLLCKKIQESPSEGFTSWPVNEVVAGIVAEQPKEFYRGSVAEKLRVGLIELKNLATKLEFEIGHGEYEIKEYCTELKRTVQLATEEEISKINEKNVQLIQTIEKYERKSLENISALTNLRQQTESLLSQAKTFIKQQETYLLQLQLNDQTTVSLNEKLEDISDELKSQRFRVKKTMFGDKLMTFVRNKTEANDKLVGSLDWKHLHSMKIIYSGMSIRLLDLENERSKIICEGHTEAINFFQVLDSNTIISCSSDGSIKVWNLKNGECLRTLTGHTNAVPNIQILPTNRLISCSYDMTIRLWCIDTGTCLKILKNCKFYVSFIKLLSNDHLAYGLGKIVKIMSIKSGQTLKKLKGHSDCVNCADILANKNIVTGSDDKSIKEWNTANGVCRKTLKGHTGYVNCVQVLKYDQILSGSKDSTIKLWCLNSGTCLKTFIGHNNLVCSLKVLPNNKFLSSSNQQEIKVFDLLTGNCEKTIDTTEGSYFIETL